MIGQENKGGKKNKSLFCEDVKFCLGYTEFPLSSPNINWVCAEHWDYKVT